MVTPTLIQPKEIVTDGIFRPTNVSTRFDNKLLAPFIPYAEETYLVDKIGSDFYDALVAAQNTDPANYNPAAGALVAKFPSNADYETLWTKLLYRYNALIVVNYALPFIGAQVTTQGVMFKNTEYAENGGIDAVKYLQNEIQKTIDKLDLRLIDYLCKNKATYPLFDSSQHCEEDCNCDNPHEDGECSECNKSKTKRNSTFKIVTYGNKY